MTDISGFSNRQPALAHLGRAKLCVLPGKFDWRAPGLKEIRTERYDRFSLVEPVNRYVVPPETCLCGRSFRFLAHPFPESKPSRTPGLQPQLGDPVERRPLRSANERD